MESKTNLFIKKIRESKTMTQVELARKSGLTAAWISHFENGRRLPSLPSFIRIADALEVTLDSLINKDNGTNKKNAN